MMKKFILLQGVFLLSACLGGYTPQSTFYTLKSIENVAPLNFAKFSIGVNLPDLPDYVDRPQIVSFSTSNNLKIDEAHRWGEDLDFMIQNTVVEDLSAFFPKAKIKSRKSFLDKYDYILSISIEKFYFVKGENVYFKAFWRLRNENSFDDVLNGETSLTLKVGDNYNSYVNELGKLIGQMCEQIAIKINKL